MVTQTSSRDQKQVMTPGGNVKPRIETAVLSVQKTVLSTSEESEIINFIILIFFFYVLLTVHLSIILVINQFNAQILVL